MSKIKTIHIVEALGGGVYTYFVTGKCVHSSDCLCVLSTD